MSLNLKYRPLLAFFVGMSAGIIFAFIYGNNKPDTVAVEQFDSSMGNSFVSEKDLDTATFGNGCFWCSEAIYQEVQGVVLVRSGYSGGKSRSPTYAEVGSGKSGHAEVVQIRYDPKKITYTKLLEIFWKTHDPTTLNRQGDDVGPQYRSIILYHNEEQKQIALNLKAQLGRLKIWRDPIVTEVVLFEKFYEAEEYHRDYYRRNRDNSYCRLVITPKLKKFRKVFSGEPGVLKQ